MGHFWVQLSQTLSCTSIWSWLVLTTFCIQVLYPANPLRYLNLFEGLLISFHRWEIGGLKRLINLYWLTQLVTGLVGFETYCSWTHCHPWWWASLVCAIKVGFWPLLGSLTHCVPQDNVLCEVGWLHALSGDGLRKRAVTMTWTIPN